MVLYGFCPEKLNETGLITIALVVFEKRFGKLKKIVSKDSYMHLWFLIGNFAAAKREYEQRFPGRRVPNHKKFSLVFHHLRTNE